MSPDGGICDSFSLDPWRKPVMREISREDLISNYTFKINFSNSTMTTATGHFDLTGRMIHDGDIVRVDNAGAGKVFGIDGVWFIDFGGGDQPRLNRYNTSMLEILN